MPQFNTWRDLARKAAQAVKRQLAQTESGLSNLLRPNKRQAIPIPVPIPQRRSPRFPGDKRYFSTSCSNPTRSVRRLTQSAFALRPRCIGTTRVHGHRAFSSTPTNHSHVVREVYASISQGLRAGTLHAPFYPPPTGSSTVGTVFYETQRVASNTILRIPLVPELTFAKHGQVLDLMSSVDEVLLLVPAYLAKLRRELRRLSKSGEFQYTLNKDNVEIVFHGKSSNQVEAFLRDIGVSLGTITEQTGIHHDTSDVNWQKTLKGARKRNASMSSLERYVMAIDEHRGRKIAV